MVMARPIKWTALRALPSMNRQTDRLGGDEEEEEEEKEGRAQPQQPLQRRSTMHHATYLPCAAHHALL